jgi:hypothetical protein
LGVRTTLNVDDDVLLAVQERAQREKRSAGEVLSDLVRQALTASINRPRGVERLVTDSGPCRCAVRQSPMNSLIVSARTNQGEGAHSRPSLAESLARLATRAGLPDRAIDRDQFAEDDGHAVRVGAHMDGGSLQVPPARDAPRGGVREEQSPKSRRAQASMRDRSKS